MLKSPGLKAFTADADTILFDLDGTLLYTVEDLASAVNAALSEYGFPVRTLEEVTSFIGNGVRVLMKRSAPEGISDDLFEKMLAFFTDYYLAHMFDSTRPYEGIPEAVAWLKASGCRLAIVSNKLDAATKKMNEKYFYPSIELAVGAPPDHKKPDPESVFFAIRELNSVPERTIYIGDTDVDLLTAENAGVRFIGCSWGFRGHEYLERLGVRHIADTPADLIKLFSLTGFQKKR